MSDSVIPSREDSEKSPAHVNGVIPSREDGEESPAHVRWLRWRVGMTLVIAVAAIAHFTYFYLRFGSFYFPDSFTYLNPARNLIHGLGFSNGKPLEPDTIRTPGYPLLLILFGLQTPLVIAFQHLLTIGVAVALYYWLLQRQQNRFVAIAAAIVYALDVPTIHIANKLLTEVPFTVLLFVVFVLSVGAPAPGAQRPRAAAATPLLLGLLVGCMVLIRPIAMFFFVLVALRIPKRQLATFIACALVLPAGWAIRNRVRSGVLTISSIGDINLLGTRAAGALAIEDGGDFRSDLTDEQRGLAEDADDFIQRKLHIPDAEELPVAVRSKYQGEYARRILLQHPLAVAELTVRGVLVNLFDSDWDALDSVTLLHPSTLEFSVGYVPVAVFIFAVIGIIALWRTDRVLGVAIGLTIGYFVLISAGGEAEYRFRVPVMPQFAIAAAVGLDVVRQKLWKVRRAAASR